MLVLPNLDEFPYEAQDPDRLDCVPCCVTMASIYLGIEVDAAEVRDQLDYHVSEGTRFRSIGNLAHIGVDVVATLDEVENFIAIGRPVIAQIEIDPEVLGYRGESDEGGLTHAVVVVGIGDTCVRFFDPLPNDPESKDCSRIAFQNAWIQGRAIRPR